MTGGLETTTAAMPPDTAVYMGVNLLQLTPENIDQVLKPVLEKIPGAEVSDMDGVFEQLDKALQDSMGITFTDDIKPWLGQYAAIGLDPSFDQYGGLSEASSLIIAIETRDTEAADAFLDKLRAAVDEQSLGAMQEEEYQGVTYYVSSYPQTLAFGRSKNMVLFAMNAESMQAAIDAQEGESLQDSEEIKNLAGQLPANRSITMFVDGDRYAELLSQGAVAPGLPNMLGTSNFQSMGKVAASLAIVDEGLRMDAVTSYDPEKMTEGQRAQLANFNQIAQAAQVAPADSMLLAAAQGLSDVLAAARESIPEEARADFDESIQMLNEQLGFDLEQDLLAYLDEEFGLVLMPGEWPPLQIPIGLVMFSHMNNQEKLKETLGKLSTSAEVNLGASVIPSEEGDNTYYDLADPYQGNIATLGLSPEYLALGLTHEQVEAVLQPSEALADHDEYKEVWGHFPNGTAPFLYVEVANLANYLQEKLGVNDAEVFRTDLAFLDAIPYLALGVLPYEGDMSHATMILFIDQAEK